MFVQKGGILKVIEPINLTEYTKKGYVPVDRPKIDKNPKQADKKPKQGKEA